MLPLRTPGSWLFAANDGGVQLREHWYLLGAEPWNDWSGRSPGRSVVAVVSILGARKLQDI